MDRVTLIKRNTSAETKTTVRVLESKTKMCLSPPSQAHVQNGGWCLTTDTVSPCSIQNTFRNSQCSSSDSQGQTLTGADLGGDGKISLGAFCCRDQSPNSKLIKAH